MAAAFAKRIEADAEKRAEELVKAEKETSAKATRDRTTNDKPPDDNTTPLGSISVGLWEDGHRGLEIERQSLKPTLERRRRSGRGMSSEKLRDPGEAIWLRHATV